jgi:uncharacterized protein YjbJ (UPF0337 family)
MNWDQVQSKWTQLVGSAKDNWSKLSDEDFAKIAGSREQLTGKIQEVYGISRREADKQIWDWGKTVENTRTKIA